LETKQAQLRKQTIMEHAENITDEENMPIFDKEYMKSKNHCWLKNILYVEVWKKIKQISVVIAPHPVALTVQTLKRLGKSSSLQ